MFQWHRSVSSITHCLRCQPPVRGRSPAKYPSFLLPTCIWHNWHLLKLVLQVCIAWSAEACQALHKLSAQSLWQIHSRRDGACHARENIFQLVIGATNVQQFRLGWKSCEWLLCWWQPGCRRFARKFFTLRALLHKKASTSDIFNNFCESTQISQ